jgi:AcrR family transcriptional regulator
MTSSAHDARDDVPARDRRTTRDQLLEAAVRLLQEGGVAALSTTRLTSEVGIVQSGFYSHFSSLEQCLAEATSRVVEEIRVPVRAWMKELRRSPPVAQELVLERLTAHFGRVLDMLVPRWQFVRLVERHRGSPGTLGEAMSTLHAELVGDVRAYLRALCRQVGIPLKGHGPRLDLLALLIVELVTAASEAVAGNPRLDRRLVAETLAVTVDGLVVRAVESMQGGAGAG